MGRTAERRASTLTLTGLCAMAVLAAPSAVRADAGGVSFWLPGAFGSLAATPVSAVKPTSD